MKDIEVEEALVLRATRAEVPLNGTFELTPICNMKCKMCYARLEPQVVREAGGLVGGKEWLKVAKEAAEAGTLFVLLTGGEPLLHPDFKEIYLGLQQMGMIVSVNTNGTLLNEEWADFFSRHMPRKINITLYGASPDTYEKVCGYGEGYEKTLHAIRLLTERGVAVKMNGTLISDNAHEYELMEKMAEDLGVYLKVDSYIFPYARRDDANIAGMRIEPREQAYYKYCEKKTKDTFLPSIKYAKEIFSVIDCEVEEGQPLPVECRAGRSSYWIDWRHKVTPCIFLTDFSVGLQDGFLKAWDLCKNRIKQLTLYAGCTNCPSRMFCSVCAAALYSEEGEYSKKPEYLCRCTREYIELLASYKEEQHENNG